VSTPTQTPRAPIIPASPPQTTASILSDASTITKSLIFVTAIVILFLH
jgi:hypothetical protein